MFVCFFCACGLLIVVATSGCCLAVVISFIVCLLLLVGFCRFDGACCGFSGACCGNALVVWFLSRFDVWLLWLFMFACWLWLFGWVTFGDLVVCLFLGFWVFGLIVCYINSVVVDCFFYVWVC